ncbi:hypothetical protein PaecuDRAFT_0207 [Paenibacillus curdlanolyticus YK9]|uniref:Uncharacterized protein n=1 Tax=Paenibacillus curdlanolyticus YK9 TaxID=717606 RepID=E0I332_9BACL|nr:hypothetical protein [Paenibacillus curdlanolyticus]EFM12696.1 hypothetical protein PaecuDRAFT_0207 [Paenibacillus curdlanolyticus YK9]
MMLWGTLLAIGLTVVLSFLFGPYGGIIVLAVLFGFVFSNYYSNKRIERDVQLIKQKLGVIEESTEEKLPDPQTPAN